MAAEGINWLATAQVIKYNPDKVARLTARYGHEPTWFHLEHLRRIGDPDGEPDDITVAEGNLLTTVGLNRLTNLMIGGGGTSLAHADLLIGVGSSSTAALVGDTALGGDGSSTTALYQQCDSSYPTQSNGVLTVNCTFGSSSANFSGGWQEWCLAVASGSLTSGATLSGVGTSPIMINHKIQNLGTKNSGAIWTLAATVTFS